jgi:hypothetical protein
MHRIIISAILSTASLTVWAAPRLDRRDAAPLTIGYSPIIGDICRISDSGDFKECACPAGTAAVSAKCEGTECSHITWRCAEIQDNRNSIFTVSTNLVDGGTTIDGATPAICPINTVGTYLGCSDHNCGYMNLKCASVSLQATVGAPLQPVAFSGDKCVWSDWAPNNAGGNTACPSGTFIRGLTTKGKWSSYISFYCCPATGVTSLLTI